MHCLSTLTTMKTNRLETENDSEDVDIKHEPLEPDVDDYVSKNACFRFNLGVL